ncbi:MAG: glycoside hydrolase [Velocimicrobium sp.]
MQSIKRALYFLMTTILLISTLTSNVLTAKAADSTVTINPEYEHQTFKGWGTSLSWWGNAIGGWQNTTKQNEILDLLYDENVGLGLNVARYNIGGGDDPTHTHMRNGANLEGYQPSPGVWNYNADATQRYILNEAIDRGVNIVEGFAKTAPYWMTYSGCSAGNVDGTSNLKPEYYDDFADYLADVYLLFKNTYGITFDSISPINEPNGPWWEVNNRQEGCHYTKQEQNDFFKVLNERFDAKGLSNVTIAGPEGFEFNSTLSSWNTYDSLAKSGIDKINTHSYYGTERLYLNTIALCSGKRLSASEYGVGVGDHDHNAIESALELSHKITDDVENLQPETWVYWQAVEEEFNVNNWGFIHASFDETENYEVTKQYYGMANYSKFIRPDSTIIGVSDSNMLVALNKNTHKLTIVVINDTASSNNYTIDLSKFATVGSTAYAYRTSSSENLAQLNNISIQNKVLQATTTPKSITTYVIDNTTSSVIPAFDRNLSYKIVNKSDNSKVLDVQGSSPDNSAAIIIMGADSNSVSQSWKFIVNTDGNYYIANANAAKMLDVPGASTANSATMALWQPNGENNQLWKITDLNNGYFSIINKNSHKALGVKNGTMTDGNSIDQYDYLAYDNQQWKFEPIY